MPEYNPQMPDATENPPGATLPRFDSVQLSQFRAFRNLSIQGLGRVNLITGRNNTGKSSVLEALRILTTNAELDVICDILRYREEDGVGEDDGSRLPDREKLLQVSGLFHGFEQLSGAREPITIASSGRSGRTTMTMRIDWFSEERDPAGNYRLVPAQASLFGDTDAVAALACIIHEGRKSVTDEGCWTASGASRTGGGRGRRRRVAFTAPGGRGGQVWPGWGKVLPGRAVPPGTETCAEPRAGSD